MFGAGRAKARHGGSLPGTLVGVWTQVGTAAGAQCGHANWRRGCRRGEHGSATTVGRSEGGRPIGSLSESIAFAPMHIGTALEYHCRIDIYDVDRMLGKNCTHR